MSQADATSGKQWFGHPRGLSTLFFTEMWERFSYYGMRALLVLYMTNAVAGMDMARETAAAIYGLYTAGVYLLALPGGWIADRLIGPKNAVFIGGIVIASGHFSMAVPSTPSFYLGLVLIVLGTGLLKPNVSAIVGDLYPEGGARRDAGFSIFYMGINLGAFAGPLICGWLAESAEFQAILGNLGIAPENSWHWGFAAAGVGMVLGLVQYRFGGGYLAGAGEIKEKASAAGRPWMRLWGGLAVLGVAAAILAGLNHVGVVAITLQGFAGGTGGFIVGLAVFYFAYQLMFGPWNWAEKKRLIVIFLLFVGAALFWSGFEQAGSSMNLFAQAKTDLAGPVITVFLALLVLGFFAAVLYRMRKTLPVFGTVLLSVLGLLGLGILFWAFTPGARTFINPASWLQSVNPLFIIMLAPVFGTLWVLLQGRGRNPSIPAKFGFGLVLLGAGFLVMRWAAQSFEAGGAAVGPSWLIVTYFLHTCGELCLSPVGLSSVTKLSPPRLVGQMMGIWFMGAALGNLIAGLAAGQPDDVMLFGQVAMISLGGGLAFLVTAKLIQRLIGKLE